MSYIPFKQKYSVVKRMNESARILSKFPDRIPVICERSTSNNTLENIDKNKFLVPQDLTASQFVTIVRNRLRLTPAHAIFLIINDIIPAPMSSISDLYYHHKDQDGFLYIQYTAENTFGIN